VAFISRGFRGRHRADVDPSRLPPGQYVVDGFPVLSAGPTPHTPLEEWSFAVTGAIGQPRTWSWQEFLALPSEQITRDIHCVTKWSKFDTVWTGVSLDVVLDGIDAGAGYISAFCDGGYTTNLPLGDVTGGKAWLAYEFDNEPLAPEHGGPVRLLVPHLYFWKSARWVRGSRRPDPGGPACWENLASHNRGGPGRAERYWRESPRRARRSHGESPAWSTFARKRRPPRRSCSMCRNGQVISPASTST